jgi:hypothetical protein
MQQFYLVFEVAGADAGKPAGAASPQRNPPPPRVLVPDGPWALALNAALQPCLRPIQEADGALGIVLQPIIKRRQCRLVMTASAPENVRVNDQPALRASVLRKKDCVRLVDCNIAFHVTLYNQPCIGQPPAALLGKECPVCRVPFSAETVCYVCQCGLGLHLEENKPGGLECAKQKSDCPSCNRPVLLSAGFVWLPNMNHE